MKEKDVAIIVVAQNISESTIKRFKKCVAASKPSHEYEIIIGTSDQPVFCKTKILNEMLRSTLDNFKVFKQI
jgi:hypothetical protein